MFCLAAARTAHDYLLRPNHWPSRADFVTWCENMDPITGAVLIFGGLFFLFSGFKTHRLLVALNGLVIGAYIGASIAMAMGISVWLGIAVGALVLGIVGWLLTAWSAAAVGAICGAMLGAALWQMLNLDVRFTWSGALTGAVALGLLCFLIFRVSVITFTSLQGAVMLVLGILGFAYQYPAVRPSVDNAIGKGPYVLPAVVLTITLIGLIYQYFKGPGGGKAAPASSGAAKKPAKKEAADE